MAIEIIMDELNGPQCEAMSATPDLSNDLDKLVSGERLLEILWDATSRPSLRWLRTQTKRRAIPFARSAGRVWFVPRMVKDAMMRVEIRRGRPRKSVN